MNVYIINVISQFFFRIVFLLILLNMIMILESRRKRDLCLYCVNVTNSFCSVFSGSTLWNSLPQELKQYSSICLLKKGVHTFLLDYLDFSR